MEEKEEGTKIDQNNQHLNAWQTFTFTVFH